jgi:ATP/maltotriose-dependent transcriptional regulator MalT
MISTAPLTRSRVLSRLHASVRYPATVICAPEGYGKTTAIRQFLDAYPAATLELGLLPEHGTLVAFARALAETLSPVAPGLRSSYAHAIEFAVQSHQAEEELSIWFLGHLDREAERTILIDDLHHACGDERIFNLIERLVKESPKGYRWLIASRMLPPAVTRWRNLGLCAAPIDETELRLTEAEMRDIASATGLSPATASSLYAMTNGWPLAFSLGTSLPRWIERLQVLRPGSAEGLYAFLAEQFFLQCDKPLQDLLLNTCVFTTIDEDVIAASPWRGSWPSAQRVAADGRLLSLRHDGSLQPRDLFREFLESRLEQQSDTAIQHACTVAAGLLEKCGRISDALRLYARAHNELGILHLCERHGFALVDEGRLDDLQQALSTVDDSAAGQNAVALAVRAIAESNAGRNDIAESWYLHAIEKAATPLPRAEIAYRYGLELVRQGRRDGIELLERYVGETLPAELDASLRSTLATAYVLAERFDDARRMIATAVSLLDGTSSKQLQAKIQHHAAWVALFTGQIATAKVCASHAVDLALECDMYDVAARAYSVLLNISADIEDNTKTTIEILDRILDCGLKAGISHMRLFALLGSIDIRAEMGDAQGVWAIEKVLDAHGIDYSEQHTSESLLPAEALMLAGRGKFAEAYDIIFPTGERQATADRRALRFSEIALYAAAAGLTTQAESALVEVKARLRECDQSARRAIRTQLNRALAARLLGNAGEGYAILEFVARYTGMMSERLRALYDAVTAIFRHWDGNDNYDEVYEALRALRQADFGGVAAAIAALPMAREHSKIA